MNIKKIDELKKQIDASKEELQNSWRLFDYATYEYIDVAIFNVRMAELKYQTLCRELKREVFKSNLQ